MITPESLSREVTKRDFETLVSLLKKESPVPVLRVYYNVSLENEDPLNLSCYIDMGLIHYVRGTHCSTLGEAYTDLLNRIKQVVARHKEEEIQKSNPVLRLFLETAKRLARTEETPWKHLGNTLEKGGE